jgi:hypothetical protein
MTVKQVILRKDLLRLIHTNDEYRNKKEADAWEDFLFVNYGVESSGKLGIEELKNLLDYLRGKGKIVKDEKSRDIYKYMARKPKPKTEKSEYCTAKQIFVIEKLWQENAEHKDSWSIRNYINNIIGRRPLHLNSMTLKEAQKVIQGIKGLKKKAKEGNGRL